MTTGRLHLSNTFLVLELVAEDDDRLEPASASQPLLLLDPKKTQPALGH